MKDYRKRLGLPVTTLIRCLEMHGHLRHQEAIFDPLELSAKETKSVRDKTGILLLHICRASDEDLKMYVEQWKNASEENIRSFHDFSAASRARNPQVSFASPHSCEMTPRNIIHTSM